MLFAIRSDQLRLEVVDHSSDGRPNILSVEIVDKSDFGMFQMLSVRVTECGHTRGEVLELQIAKQAFEAMDGMSRCQWRIYIPPEAICVMEL